jgi:hypothetical protein
MTGKRQPGELSCAFPRLKQKQPMPKSRIVRQHELVSRSRLDRASIVDRSIDVYVADQSRGWRVVRQVTPVFAYDKVSRGLWSEMFDSYGTFVGVQVIAAVKTDQDLLSGASSVTITANEVMINAGCRGRSRTIGMCEEQRINRRADGPNGDGRALPPEDRIERVMAKVKQWPLPASRIDDGRGKPVYGDRALRVYPDARHDSLGYRLK